jgi:hypothetical protein
VKQLGPSELNDGEQRAIEQTNAYFDPPKTLEELQRPPTQNVLGYEPHHIVEQNDDNVAKEVIAKFGRDAIDDPTNLMWVPRLKHELISSYYNEIDDDDPQERRRRDVIGEDDFETQRELGLAALRKFGVLQ